MQYALKNIALNKLLSEEIFQNIKFTNKSTSSGWAIVRLSFQYEILVKWTNSDDAQKSPFLLIFLF